MDLTMEKTAEKLESFLQIRLNQTRTTQTALLVRPTFNCDHHGYNSTHDTAGCRVLNDRIQREEIGVQLRTVEATLMEKESSGKGC
jgi:hypothetical protein